MTRGANKEDHTMDNRSFDQSSIQGDELPPDLQAAASRYAAQPVPRPSSAETARLVHMLVTEATFQTQYTHEKGNAPLWRIAVLTRWRVYMLGPWYWMASVLLLLAGIGLSRSFAISSIVAKAMQRLRHDCERRTPVQWSGLGLRYAATHSRRLRKDRAI